MSEEDGRKFLWMKVFGIGASENGCVEEMSVGLHGLDEGLCAVRVLNSFERDQQWGALMQKKHAQDDTVERDLQERYQQSSALTQKEASARAHSRMGRPSRVISSRLP